LKLFRVGAGKIGFGWRGSAFKEQMVNPDTLERWEIHRTSKGAKMPIEQHHPRDQRRIAKRAKAVLEAAAWIEQVKARKAASK
jgi:hypothetical protein